MMHRIDEIVVDLIAKNMGLDPADVVRASDLAGLGITSLEAITLAYELEEALGVEIPNADIESLRTVQDLIDGLNRLIAAKG